MKFIKKIKYDIEELDFQKIVFEHFKKKNNEIEKNLSDIHNKIFFKKNVLHNVAELNSPIHKLKKNYFDVRKDQKNKFVRYFYKIDPIFNMTYKKKRIGPFYNLYLKLIKHLEKKIFKEKIIYQAKPTLRVHIPDNISVGSYHRDSDYGHPKEEINLWLPFNNSKKTSSLWLESEPNKRDFKAYNVKYGELLIFDSRLHHGTEINKEKNTRLSMDFRVIKEKKYKKNFKTSPKLKIKFNIGGYFKES